MTRGLGEGINWFLFCSNRTLRMPSLMDVLSGMVTKKGRLGTDPYDIFQPQDIADAVPCKMPSPDGRGLGWGHRFKNSIGNTQAGRPRLVNSACFAKMLSPMDVSFSGMVTKRGRPNRPLHHFRNHRMSAPGNPACFARIPYPMDALGHGYKKGRLGTDPYDIFANGWIRAS